MARMMNRSQRGQAKMVRRLGRISQPTLVELTVVEEKELKVEGKPTVFYQDTQVLLVYASTPIQHIISYCEMNNISCEVTRYDTLDNFKRTYPHLTEKQPKPRAIGGRYD